MLRRNKLLVALTGTLLCNGLALADDLDEKIAGIWDIQSAGGYHGVLALDEVGGCSYFIESSGLTLQATCVMRKLGDDQIMIFGTAEGSSSGVPVFGDQLSVSSGTQVPSSTVVTLFIDTVSEEELSGQLLAGASREAVRLIRR